MHSTLFKVVNSNWRSRQRLLMSLACVMAMTAGAQNPTQGQPAGEPPIGGGRGGRGARGGGGWSGYVMGSTLSSAWAAQKELEAKGMVLSASQRNAVQDLNNSVTTMDQAVAVARDALTTATFASPSSVLSNCAAYTFGATPAVSASAWRMSSPDICFRK